MTALCTKKIPVGVADFNDMRTGDYYYIDKTLFIKDIQDKGDKVMLIPRPRRFGKTLNLSMIYYFYNCCPETWLPGAELPSTPKQEQDRSHPNRKLFDGLAISSTGPEYMDKQGRRPVIFLSFKNIKQSGWDSCLGKIKELIQGEYARHYYLLQFQGLLPHEKDFFRDIIELKGDRNSYESSLEKLLKFLNRYYSERVVILVDEYDTPIHTGFHHGYYDEIIGFIRNFLGGGLKDTGQYLEKGILTGILRIAKESIFSDLNNLGVYTLLDDEFEDKFGFTEKEVENILEQFQRRSLYPEVQHWYNGYRFGGKTIYNPWSIINFVNNRKKTFKPYWVNTSDNKLIDTLLTGGGRELKKEMELLLQGETVEKPIAENIILKEISMHEEFLWSFLLMSGYLKQSERRRDEFIERTYYKLSIPNKEVRSTYIRIVDSYFSGKVRNEYLESMHQSLVRGDVARFEEMLQHVVLGIFSYHDFGGSPERVYHALVTGLLVWMSGTHEIKSNRESGHGRYDIMLIPRNPGGTGYVMEFKSVDVKKKETVAAAGKAALKQIEEKQYAAELLDRGIIDIKKLAVIFHGKTVHVKE